MAMATTQQGWKRHEPALIAVVDSDDLPQAIEAGATEVIVDLRTADSVGTRVLNMLLDARCRLQACGGHIAVVVTPRLRRMFGLLGLDRRFVLASDRRQALELLGVADDRPFSHRARAA
jgi:anti-anti-sigma regulatory factor